MRDNGDIGATARPLRQDTPFNNFIREFMLALVAARNYRDKMMYYNFGRGRRNIVTEHSRLSNSKTYSRFCPVHNAHHKPDQYGRVCE